MKIIRLLSIVIMLFVAGCAVNSDTSLNSSDAAISKSVANTSSRPNPRLESRLGTQWGEGLQDSVRNVDLKRMSQDPVQTIEISYSATPLSGTTVKEVMIADGRIGLSILNEKGQKLSMTQQGARIHLQGKRDERYQLFYRSYNKNRTYEVVATVDGIDVINGTTGSFKNRGYVLYPEQTLTITGFRKNSNEVAAFRFARPNNAYAANTEAGDIRNVGVIGTAVFMLNGAKNSNKQSNQPKPNAFPNEKGYAPAPRYNN